MEFVGDRCVVCSSMIIVLEYWGPSKAKKPIGREEISEEALGGLSSSENEGG